MSSEYTSDNNFEKNLDKNSLSSGEEINKMKQRPEIETNTKNR